jgi:hypothetical protein
MRLFLLISGLCFSLFLFAQKKEAKDSLRYDSSAVTQLHFSDSAFNAYNSDKDFQYEAKVVETPSLWDRFWRWFWRLYAEIISSPAGRVTMNILYWALGIGAILFFVFKITRMNKLAMFSRESVSNIPYDINSDDINAIPFD